MLHIQFTIITLVPRTWVVIDHKSLTTVQDEVMGNIINNFLWYLPVSILENVEHCGGEPEQADTGISYH